jgi:integrase
MLLEVAKDGNLYVLILTAVTTGMREGELLGLRWQDVDLDAGTLHVVNTVQPVRGVGMVDVEPKTASSRRLIMLAPSVVAALRRHRSAQLRVGGYVFCMASGKAIHPSNLVKAFKALLVEAGLPAMRFHDLRHSCASLLLAANVHPRVVQELLGHSQIALTLQTYSHTLPTMGAEVAARMEEVVQNACNSPKNPERSAHDITAGRVG